VTIHRLKAMYRGDRGRITSFVSANPLAISLTIRN
jgi:hypothetical protein